MRTNKQQKNDMAEEDGNANEEFWKQLEKFGATRTSDGYIHVKIPPSVQVFGHAN
jgi:hypothetical protein